MDNVNAKLYTCDYDKSLFANDQGPINCSNNISLKLRFSRLTSPLWTGKLMQWEENSVFSILSNQHSFFSLQQNLFCLNNLFLTSEAKKQKLKFELKDNQYR